MISFPERLVLARKRKALTQGILAEKIGIRSGKQTIYKWERGDAEPSLSQLVKLADALETTVCWLVEENETLPAVQEAPPGYILMKVEEVIALQRQLIEQQNK